MTTDIVPTIQNRLTRRANIVALRHRALGWLDEAAADLKASMASEDPLARVALLARDLAAACDRVQVLTYHLADVYATTGVQL